MGSINETVDVLFRLLEHWYNPSGLVVSLIATVIIEISFLASTKVPLWLWPIAIVITLLLISVSWFYSNHPPRVHKNKIGFLVCIACADDAESEKVREDFVIPLRRLIKSGKAGRLFHFIELPNRIAKNVVDIEDAEALRIKCRAHFMLHGRVRLRTLDGKDHHVIDLEGSVAHRPIPVSIGKAFAMEFSELLPRKVTIAQENDLLSFQFTSEWADTVARYIIGIAAALSGDADHAEILYSEALERLQSRDESFPIYNKLKERIPIRISELNENRAYRAYLAWASNHDLRYIDEMGLHLKKVTESRQDEPRNTFLRAIYAFLIDEAVEESIAILNKSRNQNDGIWHYNLAFLYAYKGDLKTALRHYRKAILFQIEPEVLSQIEDFICWVLNRSPHKYQLKYCLGFINWKVKGDNIQAEKDFQEFLSSGKASEFTKERELASEWIQSLNVSKVIV
jgi:tetratricopeptide (TPR) repeat protein